MPVPAIPTLQHVGLQTRIWPNNGFAGLTLDVTDPPFNNIHVRKAIAYAVDRVVWSKPPTQGRANPYPPSTRHRLSYRTFLNRSSQKLIAQSLPIRLT